MKHCILFLVLSLSFCIYLSSANGTSKRNKCPPDDVLALCSNQFEGVCAFFKNKSHGKRLSQKYSANGCIACLDSRVKYFIEGPCTGNKVFCDNVGRPEACTEEYNPVCGYSSDCEGDQCSITAGNKCMACADPEIDWYVPGECPDKPVNNSTVCDPNHRPEVCTFIYDPVCATLKGCSDPMTYGNACAACADPKVISHVPGECPPVVTECDPDNRPEVCPEIYDPVCATLADCSGTSCAQTYGNGCFACSDSNVISHIPGECPLVVTECDPDNRPELCPDIYKPVCATLEDCSGGSCEQTYGNACYACTDPNVLSHVPGECQNVLVKCDPNNRPDVCDDIYDPVCASLIDCGDLCTATYSNGCSACADPNVSGHVPGECPL